MTIRTAIPAHPSNYHVGRITSQIRYIVIHDGETPESDQAAEGMGNWFATQHPAGQAGSTHKGTDTNSICSYVNDIDTAYGAPYVNADGLHVEQAGRASQSAADWSDAASTAIIANTAIVVAEWSMGWHIPIRQMTDAQLLSRAYAGVITHRQASRVFYPGGHTDPGANYPMDKLLVQANRILVPPTYPPVIVRPATKILLKVDGIFGRASIGRLQQWIGVKADGVLGPVTWSAVQRRLRLTPDGVAGRLTWLRLQSLTGLPRWEQDGHPGPVTYKALQSYLNKQP